jgi:hypothetical protein
MLLRADHMFDSGAKFIRQSPVRDQNQTNHMRLLIGLNLARVFCANQAAA